jgi:hypothetical protein
LAVNLDPFVFRATFLPSKASLPSCPACPTSGSRGSSSPVRHWPVLHPCMVNILNK